METENYKATIATALSNVYSWESANLEEDFADYVTELCPHVSRESAIKILKSFDQLDPVERDSATFQMTDFVQRVISEL